MLVRYMLSLSSLSTHSTLTQAFLTFKTLFNISLLGWWLIFLLKPNSCSSDSKTNLPKYRTLHLTPPTLLEILALSLTNILPSLTKLHLSPKPATIKFVSFAVSGHTSIPQLPVLLLPLSFTPNLTTVILSTINCLSLNYPVFSRSRTVLLVLSLKLLSPVTSLPSYALHWPRINECIEYKLLSLTYKVLTTTQPPYLYNLVSVQCPRSTRSSSVVTLARPPSSSSLKITDHSFRYASPCLWNQLPLSLRQPHSGTSSDSPITSPITSSSFVSQLCSSLTPSLFHSRLKNYLLHKFYSRSFTSSFRTAFTDFCLHHFFWANRFLFFVFP